MRFIFVHFMANKLTEIKKKKIHIAFAISHSNSNLSKKKNAKDFSHNGLVCSQYIKQCHLDYKKNNQNILLHSTPR